jgi:hypothetical protein
VDAPKRKCRATGRFNLAPIALPKVTAKSWLGTIHCKRQTNGGSITLGGAPVSPHYDNIADAIRGVVSDDGDTQAARPQIGCYMSSDDAAKLSAYAKRLGVKRSILVFLLVLRELNCNRLVTLHDLYPYEGKKKGLSRVTARLSTKTLKRAFDAHIARHNIGSDEAAWALFQAELTERWLDKSLCSGNPD